MICVYIEIVLPVPHRFELEIRILPVRVRRKSGKSGGKNNRIRIDLPYRLVRNPGNVNVIGGAESGKAQIRLIPYFPYGNFPPIAGNRLLRIVAPCRQIGFRTAPDPRIRILPQRLRRGISGCENQHALNGNALGSENLHDRVEQRVVEIIRIHLRLNHIPGDRRTHEIRAEPARQPGLPLTVLNRPSARMRTDAEHEIPLAMVILRQLGKQRQPRFPRRPGRAGMELPAQRPVSETRKPLRQRNENAFPRIDLPRFAERHDNSGKRGQGSFQLERQNFAGTVGKRQGDRLPRRINLEWFGTFKPHTERMGGVPVQIEPGSMKRKLVFLFRPRQFNRNDPGLRQRREIQPNPISARSEGAAPALIPLFSCHAGQFDRHRLIGVKRTIENCCQNPIILSDAKGAL